MWRLPNWASCGRRLAIVALQPFCNRQGLPDNRESEWLGTRFTTCASSPVACDTHGPPSSSPARRAPPQAPTQKGVLPQRRPPSDWPWTESPPDMLFNYYIWANLESLSHFRQLRGLNAFEFVPNCGEVDATNHLVSAFLLANAVAGGTCMKHVPVVQYLYYLAQIGIYSSPLCRCWPPAFDGPQRGGGWRLAALALQPFFVTAGACPTTACPTASNPFCRCSGNSRREAAGRLQERHCKSGYWRLESGRRATGDRSGWAGADSDPRGGGRGLQLPLQAQA